MLHVLRSKSSILGTGSVAFGFKNINDAHVCVNHMRIKGSMAKIWYTAIKPDKFVLTTSPKRIQDYNTILDCFEIESINTNDLLQEMLDYNLCVRVITDISIDHEITTLYSEYGYEPVYTNENAIILLERMLHI